MGFNSDQQNFHNVSLGQGQEAVAERAMDVAAKMGHWVILQNIHLVKKWLPALEKKLEISPDATHQKYRIFMSAEPASTPSGHIIPQVHNTTIFPLVNKLLSKISMSNIFRESWSPQLK